jgi:death-on-curing protein
MRYLTLAEVLELHTRVLAATGGSSGIRDLRVIESAVAQPKATFDEQDLYPTVPEKAVALGYALIRGHGFVDGNKRVAHAALEVFLVLNGLELGPGVDEQERVFLALAAGSMRREEFLTWLRAALLTR